MRDDKKSDNGFLSKPTARKYKECWFILSAGMKDMCSSVVWMTSCPGYLSALTATDKKVFICPLCET